MDIGFPPSLWVILFGRILTDVLSLWLILFSISGTHFPDDSKKYIAGKSYFTNELDVPDDQYSIVIVGNKGTQADIRRQFSPSYIPKDELKFGGFIPENYNIIEIKTITCKQKKKEYVVFAFHQECKEKLSYYSIGFLILEKESKSGKFKKVFEHKTEEDTGVYTNLYIADVNANGKIDILLNFVILAGSGWRDVVEIFEMDEAC